MSSESENVYVDGLSFRMGDTEYIGKDDPLSVDMPMVTFVYSSDHDWVQVYKGDECISEGHSVQVPELLKSLGVNVRSMEVTNKYAEEMGRWPQHFSQIPFNALRYAEE